MRSHQPDTLLDEGRTDLNYTQEPNNSSSAKEGSGDKDGWDDTCSFHSKLCHHEPNNLDTPSHHTPTPPSLSPVLSESILEPPGDLSPSPASRIVTETPSLPEKLERKACRAALSSSVHISPSSPCATWNVLLSEKNRFWECQGCQEIELVAFMFFFELLFSYVSSQFPSMFSLPTYSQSFFPLSADYPRHSRQRRSENSILLIQDKSKNHFMT